MFPIAAPKAQGAPIGTLAAGATLSGATAPRALVTIGAPWAFGAAIGNIGSIRTAGRHYGATRLSAQIDALSEAFGAVPVALFQQLFALIDPIQAARKFRRFASLDPDCAEATLFVALEDWLADGVPMAGPAAKTLLIDWYLGDAPGRGRWPRQDRAPLPRALVVAGRRDSIAQSAMARPLAARLGADLLEPSLGHVGMITGSRAGREVLAPVVEFLRAGA
ncbi:MAG: hypothetical protein AAFV96_10030 [Pseudomonadota bacterium]